MSDLQTQSEIKQKMLLLANISVAVDTKYSNLYTPDSKESCILINIINGNENPHVEGLFSGTGKAVEFQRRIAINMSLELYPEEVDDCNGCMNEDSFYEFVFDFMNINYRIIAVDQYHIDFDKPVYLIQDWDKESSGTPDNYLTNSLEHWLRHQLHLPSHSWKEECTLQVDPVIPGLSISKFY